MWAEAGQTGAGRPWLAANGVSIGIVGAVVLVNAIAWGIPLLTGASRNAEAEIIHGSDLRHPASRVATGAVPLPRPVTRVVTDADTATVRPSLVPLPAPAPAPDGDLSGRRLARAPAAAPPTLYPRPERAPERLLAPPPKPAPPADEHRPVRTVGIVERDAQDVAIVSPYAPGVRLGAAGKERPAARRAIGQGFDGQGRDMTLERARAIARQATRRYERMRARLDGRAPPRQHASRDAAPPQSSNPAPVSLFATRSASPGAPTSEIKSAVAELTPRIVRRPLDARTGPPADVTVAPAEVETDTPVSAPLAARDVPVPVINRDVTQRATVLASVQPVVGDPATSTAAEPRSATRPSRRARQRGPERSARADRTPRRIERRRRRAKMIDGFRPAFHRQLVSANFFGGQN